jgi:hypothetical protein
MAGELSSTVGQQGAREAQAEAAAGSRSSTGAIGLFSRTDWRFVAASLRPCVVANGRCDLKQGSQSDPIAVHLLTHEKGQPVSHLT